MEQICFTIGYEKRTLEDLVKSLVSNHVEALIDVREFAFSRRPEFRKSYLKTALMKNGIEYVHVKELGSTKELREELHTTNDYPQFFREYSSLLENNLDSLKSVLALIASGKKLCLLCYEREHDKCHRFVLSKKLIKLNNNGLRIEPIP